MTVPLAVLKANMVTFTPTLNAKKKAAIQNLGAGLVEKVNILRSVFGATLWHVWGCNFVYVACFNVISGCSEVSHSVLA